MPNHYIRRLLWLVAGMLVSAVGITMMLQANIGLEPWSVLQQGLAQALGITYGTASMIVGAAAIGAAVLCGESFGFGTIINICLLYTSTTIATMIQKPLPIPKIP